MSAISTTDELVFSVASAGASVCAEESVGEMTDHRLLEETKAGDGADWPRAGHDEGHRNGNWATPRDAAGLWRRRRHV